MSDRIKARQGHRDWAFYLEWVFLGAMLLATVLAGGSPSHSRPPKDFIASDDAFHAAPGTEHRVAKRKPINAWRHALEENDRVRLQMVDMEWAPEGLTGN
jgi:hypothetical protein